MHNCRKPIASFLWSTPAAPGFSSSRFLSTIFFRLLSVTHFLLFIAYAASPENTLADDGFKIFMSPTGYDSTNGETISHPVKSLERVKVLVSGALARGVKTVQVEIGPGVYAGQSVLWDIVAPGARVDVVGPPPERGEAVFDGTKATRTFWVVRILTPSKEALETNLSISNITVRNYCEGISFGDFLSKAFVRGNRLSNIWFDRIGTKHESPDGLKRGNCVAAVRLQRAQDTLLANLQFSHIDNLPQSETDSNRYGPLALHSIYIADGSTKVTVSNSDFKLFTGSPIRIRNRSDDVSILDNSFSAPTYVRNSPSQRRYVIAAVSQWNCTTKNNACVSKPAECPSRNIRIRGNRVKDGMQVYDDETRFRGAPTCENGKILRDYRASTNGYEVRID